MEDIIRRAVTKAIKNIGGKVTSMYFDDSGIQVELGKGWTEYLEYENYYSIIFNHDFAKAFWGDKDWKRHLRAMVLINPPIDYIRKFIA